MLQQGDGFQPVLPGFTMPSLCSYNALGHPWALGFPAAVQTVSPVLLGMVIFP